MKTTAASTDACRRCTALLPSGAARCSLCGWPAGVGFPPAEGALPPGAPAESTARSESDDAQLDALTGITERRDLGAEESTTQTAEDEPTAQDAGPDEVDTTDTVMVVDAESTGDPVVAFEEPDPLTAPLETLVPIVELYDERGADAGEIDDTSPTSRRTFDVQRLAQVFIVGAALTNLAVAGLGMIAADSTALLALALVSLAVWTTSVITFLHWVSRTYSHVVSTSPVQQRHGATMAVAGWLIPVVGAVVGYRVLQDLWAGSDPRSRSNLSAPPAKARLIDVWLLGLVTAAVFGYVLPLALGDSALWGILSAIGVVTAALALIRVMSTLGDWSTDAVATPLLDHEPAQLVDEGTVTRRVDDLEPTLPTPEVAEDAQTVSTG